ncbi:hypothetical protein U9M48_032463 [Paspalum notatum var. saurae]|uniref:Uncharacterized protein n=1 Tax=Paspalum notatum var. saurae TaxID=547442 RepID=A0AAQ3U555_PASNO
MHCERKPVEAEDIVLLPDPQSSELDKSTYVSLSSDKLRKRIVVDNDFDHCGFTWPARIVEVILMASRSQKWHHTDSEVELTEDWGGYAANARIV